MMRETSVDIIRVVRELSRIYGGVYPWQVAPEVGYSEEWVRVRMRRLAEKGHLERVGCSKCRKGYRPNRVN